MADQKSSGLSAPDLQWAICLDIQSQYRIALHIELWESIHNVSAPKYRGNIISWGPCPNPDHASVACIHECIQQITRECVFNPALPFFSLSPGWGWIWWVVPFSLCGSVWVQFVTLSPWHNSISFVKRISHSQCVSGRKRTKPNSTTKHQKVGSFQYNKPLPANKKIDCEQIKQSKIKS